MIAGPLALGAALALSACGTSAPHAASVIDGVPATSISVGLSEVACTTSSVCVAAGTSSLGVGPVASAQFMTPSGHWYPLATPASATPRLDAAACTASSCLFAGSLGRTDLLWRFDATTRQLTPATPPPGGIGVKVVTCDGVVNCALIDDGANGVPRFSFSADAGATWSSPLPMTWAAGLNVTSLRCGAMFHCLASVATSTRALVQGTIDGGLNWYPLGGAATTWTALQLSWCHHRSCVALATGSSDAIVRTYDDGVTWATHPLHARVNSLSCISMRRCVAVGATSRGRAWLARVNGSTVTSLKLRYVPTPLVAVACGTARCGAIGVTTLVSVPTS